MKLHKHPGYGFINTFINSRSEISQPSNNAVYNYKELLNEVAGIIGYFNEIKIEQGKRVLIFSANNYDMLKLMLACLFYGVVYVPVFPGFSEEKNGEIIRYIEPDFIYINKNVKVKLTKSQQNNFMQIPESSKTQSNCVSSIKKKLNKLSLNQTACIYFSSGTTGNLKGIEITYKNISYQINAHKKIFNIKKNDTIFSHLPWYHCFGGILELFNALNAGANLVISEKGAKDFKTFYENIIGHKPSIIFSVPAVFNKLINTGISKNEINKVIHEGHRYFFSGGAILNKRVFDKITQNNGKIFQGWGQTEATPGITSQDTNKKCVYGSVGKALPGCKMKLTKENEILAKGPNVMKAYWQKPDLNKEKINYKGWLHTGDLGVIKNGELYITGRKEDYFKLSNAKKVYSADIEKKLMDLDNVSGAVLGMDGYDFAVAVVFIPEFDDEIEKYLIENVIKINNQNPEKYSRIKEIAIIKREPDLQKNEITPSMKLIKKKILDLYINNNIFKILKIPR